MLSIAGSMNAWLAEQVAAGGRPFGSLAIGARFRFRGSEIVFRKTSAGWHQQDDPPSRKWRTGRGTLVFPMEGR